MGYSLRCFLSGCILFAVLKVAMAAPAAPSPPATMPASEMVTVTLSPDAHASEISRRFLGLSYEMKVVLPKNGKYYFDAHDANLVRMFRTLGIKSLRVGANAVDDPKIGVPDTKDIDALFKFAKKAGVKVIYSFRLKNGDRANAARLAAYITKHYSSALDCFSIGNEPNFYLKPYEAFHDEWQREEQAILQAVPHAMFDGPASAGSEYALKFAGDFFPGGHLKIVSDHTYPLGNARDAEKHPAVARAQFVSNRTQRHYQKMFDTEAQPLAEKHIPFRLDETNSCYHGGARGISDSYASALWGLDYLNWWAAHHIVGLNFHTGDTVDGFPDMAANYAAFVHSANGNDFDVHPMAYAMLAFTQIAHGKPMEVKVDAPAALNFSAYGYENDGKIDVVLLNKSYGKSGHAVNVALVLQQNILTRYSRMDLTQKDSDIAAKAGLSLGGAEIGPRGKWDGEWKKFKDGRVRMTVSVQPASVILLRFTHGNI